MFGSALIESRSLLRCSTRLALSRSLSFNMVNRTNVLATCIILGCFIILFEFLLGIPATETVAIFWGSCACIHKWSFGRGPHLSCGCRMLWGLLERLKAYSDRTYRHNRHKVENNSQLKLLRSCTNQRQIGPWRFASGWHAMKYECHLNHRQWSIYSKVLIDSQALIRLEPTAVSRKLRNYVFNAFGYKSKVPVWLRESLSDFDYIHYLR